MGRPFCRTVLVVVPSVVCGAICENYANTECDTMNDGGCACSWDPGRESCYITDVCDGVGPTGVELESTSMSTSMSTNMSTSMMDMHENNADENGTMTEDDDNASASDSLVALAGASSPLLSPVILAAWFFLAQWQSCGRGIDNF
mmetsp:Transcript_2520/g.7463  ORF Transcript_2520/g.7463 Transcript_2520/m.7463 type:complete len:145 (-) Transcript_2520:7-441(-)